MVRAFSEKVDTGFSQKNATKQEIGAVDYVNPDKNRSKKLILASSSKYRAKILKNAGLDVMIQPAQIDERSVEREMGQTAPDILALQLSVAKAREVARRFPDSCIIGCDQILELEGKVLHKPSNMAEAKQRLRALSGKVHKLHSAIVLFQGDRLIWRHVETAKMTVRSLEEAFLTRYLIKVGEAVLTSVGVYQIEGLGIQIFDEIEGDYFTIIGLPLLPLLHQLRQLDLVEI